MSAHTVSKVSKKRLARRPVEQTRALMLDAAVRVLLRALGDGSNEVLAVAVSNVRVPDVVAEATRQAVEAQGGSLEEFHPLTIGALYQIWPSQPEFQADLLLHLAQLGAVVYPTTETTRSHIADGIGGRDLLRITMVEAWRHAREDQVFQAMLAAYPRVANEQIRSVLAQGYQHFVTEVAGAWSLMLSEGGRQLRPDVHVTHLARAIAAVLEGFTLQWLVDPAALEEPEGTNQLDLVTKTVIAVVEAFTEPGGPNS